MNLVTDYARDLPEAQRDRLERFGGAVLETARQEHRCNHCHVQLRRAR